MTPFYTASLSVLEEIFDGMVDLVRPFDADCLNWTPLPADTNSIATMIVHTMGATNSWLARALDEKLARDRDAELRAQANSGELIDLIESTRQEIRQRFERLGPIDPGTVRKVRRLSTNTDADVTIAWSIQHAVGHAYEHWGQIQLTKQIYAAR